MFLIIHSSLNLHAMKNYYTTCSKRLGIYSSTDFFPGLFLILSFIIISNSVFAQLFTTAKLLLANNFLT